MTTIVQAVWGDIPEALQAGPRNVAAFAESRGWEYELVQGPAVDSPRNEWDMLKFLTLSTVPGAVMVDLDCVLLDGFEYIEDDRPHCGYFPAVGSESCTPQPDTFLCYGPCSWWDLQLRNAAERCIIDRWCWPRKLLRDSRDVVPIPHEHWRHTMYTAGGGRISPITGCVIKRRST